MVAQSNLGGPEFVGHPVQHPSAKPRAERAHRLALGNHALHNAVGVLGLDVKGHAQRLQVIGQDIGREARMALVEVDGDQFKVDGRTGPQRHENVQQPVAVLPTGEADHDLVARLDHLKVGNGLAHKTVQAFGPLVVLGLRTPSVLRQGLEQAGYGDGCHAKTSMPTVSQSG